ncbi:OmpA family protein [bacterium]|nr:OmpA family protein [bacterium]
MRLRLFVALISLAAATLPGTAIPSDNYLGGLATYADPDDARDADFGAGGHVLFGWPLGERLSLEMGVFGADIKRESNSDLDDFYYAIGPDVLFAPRKNSFSSNIVAPYLLGGVGIFLDDVMRERDEAPYANVGLGVLLPLGRSHRLRLRIEGRYLRVFGDDAVAATTPGVTEDDFDELQGSIGLQLAVGDVVAAGVSDLDGDGVRDERDKCPNTPEGVPVDVNGCALDSDGDSVADYKDKCPGTPAGAPVDEDGCARDDDGDGVSNLIDACPGTPPGTEVDARGCSEQFTCDDCDSCQGDCDKDGVVNAIDQCPGTLPGLTVDEVGCVREAQTLVLEGVEFEFDKARLTPNSQTTLDQVAATMIGQPDMRVLIAGHTDSLGSDAYNLNLSRLRAASVRRYLIGKGVPAEQLRSRGFGETKPIDTNATEAGRQNNRRVEFQVLNPSTP